MVFLERQTGESSLCVVICWRSVANILPISVTYVSPVHFSCRLATATDMSVAYRRHIVIWQSLASTMFIENLLMVVWAPAKDAQGCSEEIRSAIL